MAKNNKISEFLLKFSMMLAAAVMAILALQIPCLAKNTGRDLSVKFRDKDPMSLTEAGVTYLNRNELDSALVCFSLLVQQTSPQSKDKEEAECHVVGLNGLGIIHFLYGNYAQSYAMFSNAIKADPLYVDAYQNLASIYEIFGKYDEARKQLHTAYRLQINQGDIEHATVAFINLANIDIQNDLTANSDTIISSFSKLELDDSPLYRYAICVRDGATDILAGRHMEALDDFKKAISLYEDIDPRLMVSMELNIAKTFATINKNDSAIHHYQNAMAMADEFEYDDVTIETGKRLADIYDKVGDPRKAKDLRYRALMLADSVSNYNEFDKIKNFEFQATVDRQNKEITEANEKRRIQTVMLIAATAICLILCIVVIVLIRQRKMLRMKDQKLFDTIKHDASITSATSIMTETHSAPMDGEVFEGNVPMADEADGIDKSESSQKEYRNQIDPERAERLQNAIASAIEDEKNTLSIDFTLQTLADIVGDTPKNVSQIINQYFGKNFNALVNERRVKAFIARMDDSRYANYTIDAIAEELGFKSRSTFSKVFTSITGMSPTTYRRMLSHTSL